MNQKLTGALVGASASAAADYGRKSTMVANKLAIGGVDFGPTLVAAGAGAVVGLLGKSGAMAGAATGAVADAAGKLSLSLLPPNAILEVGGLDLVKAGISAAVGFLALPVIKKI